MVWGIFAALAICAVAVSDIFRKLGSNLKDPFLSNVIFQSASFLVAVLLYLFFSRKYESNFSGVVYSLIGGALISVFTLATFKALEIGPGVSVVVPVIRIGGVLLVSVLGILLLKERLTLSLAMGILLSAIGIYMIFQSYNTQS